MNYLTHRCQSYVEGVIRQERQGRIASLCRLLLKGGSVLYKGVVRCRNWAYDQKVFRQYYPPVPVVSIGNIVSGGTGKTPFTIMLAKAFEEQCQVAILTRGYRSRAERGHGPKRLSFSDLETAQASEYGDEPMLLATHLPRTRIYIGRDRRASSVAAVSEGADLILLDDGMQHRRLARDFEVVLVDAKEPLSNGLMLPAGLLREGPRALARASLIVVSGSTSEEEFLKTSILLSAYTSAPMVAVAYAVESVTDFLTGAPLNLAMNKVGMFCGIAKPGRFKLTLEGANASVVAVRQGLDHVGISERALGIFAKRAIEAGASYLVCTEKDALRLPKDLSLDLPIGVVSMTMTVRDGLLPWGNFIRALKDRIPG